ncbi:MAG: hypothetical protein ACXW1A_04690 [Nitrososphaeraceae archaeon]
MHLLSLFIEEDVKYGCYAANLTPILFFNTILVVLVLVIVIVIVIVIVFSVASLVFAIVVVVIKILILKFNMFSDDGVDRDGRECTN